MDMYQILKKLSGVNTESARAAIEQVTKFNKVEPTGLLAEMAKVEEDRAGAIAQDAHTKKAAGSEQIYIRGEKTYPSGAKTIGINAGDKPGYFFNKDPARVYTTITRDPTAPNNWYGTTDRKTTNFVRGQIDDYNTLASESMDDVDEGITLVPRTDPESTTIQTNVPGQKYSTSDASTIDMINQQKADVRDLNQGFNKPMYTSTPSTNEAALSPMDWEGAHALEAEKGKTIANLEERKNRLLARYPEFGHEIRRAYARYVRDINDARESHTVAAIPGFFNNYLSKYLNINEDGRILDKKLSESNDTGLSQTILNGLLHGDIDMYDVLAGDYDSFAKSDAIILQQMFDDAALDNNLDTDADYEKIIKIVLRRLKNEHRITEAETNANSTFEAILKNHRRNIQDMMKNGADMSNDLYAVLYDYYHDRMPIGTAKGRTGDPIEAVHDLFWDEIESDEDHYTGIIFAGRKLSEGKVNELSLDIKELTDRAFVKKYGKPKRAFLDNKPAKPAKQDKPATSKEVTEVSSGVKGVPTMIVASDAAKTLRKYGATGFRAKGNKLVFSNKKTGEEMGIPFKDENGDRYVSISAMNKIARKLRGQGATNKEELGEKAVSQKQQKFMGMVRAAQKGEKPASKEVAKVAKTMSKSDVEDFASTKHKGLPKKANEEDFIASKNKSLVEKKPKEVEETTSAGSVATVTAPKTNSGSIKGVQVGKGIYDSLNRQVESMISESLNVNVSVNKDSNNTPTKSITVNAEGADADNLAQVLKLSGLVDSVSGYQPVNFDNAADSDNNTGIAVISVKPSIVGASTDSGLTDNNISDPLSQMMKLSGVSTGYSPVGYGSCGSNEEQVDEELANEPDVKYANTDTLVNKLSGGLNKQHLQINPNNPGDNPMAMRKLGHNHSGQVNLEETAKIKSRLAEEYSEYDYDDDEPEDEGFFVFIGSEETGGFVGMITKEDGRWRERSYRGKAPYGWGGTYMGYLKPSDVMSWIYKDYGRNYQVEGPFTNEDEANEYFDDMS